MFDWLRRYFSRRRESVMFERAVVVADNDGTITATYPNGERQSVTWADLIAIEVQTNDSGPWGADVWWVLRGRTQSCTYPQGATGEPELIPKFQALAGFDDEMLIRAMGCTSNKRFLCWQRESAT